MWTRPWQYKDGITAGAGLFLTGSVLQLAVGKIDWDLFACPVNIIALVAYLLILVTLHLLRNRIYIVRWLSSTPSAVASMGWVAVMTAVMGLIRQVPSTTQGELYPGFTQMLSNWSFVLICFWLVTSLFLTTLRVCIPFKVKKIPFLLNHLGLFIALVCGVLGSADLMKLNMTSFVDAPEWRAMDGSGNLHELPIAVELTEFTIDEYPPEIMLADNETGASLKGEKAGCYSIEIKEILEESAPVFTDDSVKYSPYHSAGACASAFVSVTRPDSEIVTGWISCGSFAFPFKSLKIDEEVSAVMPERNPQRYVSAVNIYTKSGKSLTDTIKVNTPCRIEGWKIYQLDYDHNKGKWSGYSVFEIVRDPWLPAVYTGILMLIAGAVCMFVQFGRKKEVKK